MDSFFHFSNNKTVKILTLPFIILLLFSCQTREIHLLSTGSSSPELETKRSKVEVQIPKNEEENSNKVEESKIESLINNEINENIEGITKEAKDDGEQSIKIEEVETERDNDSILSSINANAANSENQNREKVDESLNPMPLILEKKVEGLPLLLVIIFVVDLLFISISEVIRNAVKRPLLYRQSVPLTLFFTFLPILISSLVMGWSNWLLLYLPILFSIIIMSFHNGY